MIVRRQVPFVGVDLDRDAELRPPRVRPGDERVAVVDGRVEQRRREPRFREQVLEVSLRGGPDSVDHVTQRLAEQRRPRDCSRVEFRDELVHVAPPPLHGIGHDRAHVAQAGQAADRVRDRPRSERKPDWAEIVDAIGHATGPMQPCEARIPALPRERDKHVHELRLRSPDAVGKYGGRTGDHASGSAVQLSGYLLLSHGRNTGSSDIHGRQQHPPGAARPEPVPQRALRDAGRAGLSQRDHVKLTIEDHGQSRPVKACCRSHTRIMRTWTDISGADNDVIAAIMRT